MEEPPRFFETAVAALHMEDSDYVSKLPEDFYSSDHYATKMLQYLEERSTGGKGEAILSLIYPSQLHTGLCKPPKNPWTSTADATMMVPKHSDYADCRG